MDNYISQKECLDRLYEEGIATFKAPSFVEAVQKGQIRYHNIKGKKKKYYIYEEVREDIIKAGIGGKNNSKSKKTWEKLKKDNATIEDIPDPDEDMTPIEYGEMAVAKLGKQPTMTEVNIYKVLYQGKLEKLKYEKELKTLISREEVENKAFIVARNIRDKLMTIPERLSAELASKNDPHEVKELLYSELTKILDKLSKDSFLDDK